MAPPWFVMDLSIYWIDSSSPISATKCPDYIHVVYKSQSMDIFFSSTPDLLSAHGGGDG